MDLTDASSSPLRKRDSQGNPKAGGRVPFVHAKHCLQVSSGCLLSSGALLFWMLMSQGSVMMIRQDHQGARGSKRLSGQVSKWMPADRQGGTKTLLTAM